ncbi:hypothetical protein HMPREF1417_00542 [Helicobacter pylori GAM260Bi]|uniref:hypothetical protein n=1 Tax=Helicobacter pylori TaxID=210 RepID=UPI0002B9483D|nr:hypothetical protein [Helicobacter pylori]EMH21010.1 hypothetical protein HMPREF1417_00542 [Helicobacter pylori GAM260Bi]EMH70774.1 hypothetical protein HMPREF1452_00786 [Helicobacter pylori HP260Bi]
MPYGLIFRAFRGIMPYIIIVILLVFSANLKTKLALANERLSLNEARLIKQNEVIQKMELESQKYKANKLLEITKTKDKYHKIVIKDHTCEAKLESLEVLINAFKKNNP